MALIKRKVKHLRLDNSAVDSFMHCQAYWKNYYVDGLRQQGGSSGDAAELGVAVHKSLEEYYLGKQVSDSDNPRVKPIVDYYISRYPIEQDSFKVISVEKKIEIPMEDWLTLVMRIDLLAEDTLTHENIIIDHKTSSNLSFLNRKLHSNQFTCYLFGSGAIGHESYGGLINGICTKPEVYEKAKQEDKRLSRLFFSRTNYQISKWKDFFFKMAEEMRDKLERNEEFVPKMNDDCFKYVKPCYLMQVCTAENKELEISAKSELVVDSWENFSVEYDQ